MEANFVAKYQQCLAGIWFKFPPGGLNVVSQPSLPLVASCVSSIHMGISIPSSRLWLYGGMCVQLIYRLCVGLVCCSSTGQASFLQSFVFIVCVCVSACDLYGSCLVLCTCCTRQNEQTGLLAGPRLDFLPLDSVHLRIQICTHLQVFYCLFVLSPSCNTCINLHVFFD